MSAYSLLIKDEGGQPVNGYLAFLDADGTEINRIEVPALGAVFMLQDVDPGTAMYKIGADGYKWLSLSALPINGIITLEKKSVGILVVGGILAALFLIITSGNK